METIDIKLDAITDPHFQPRGPLEVEGIEALANSIKEIGLINPVVVRETEAGFELVTGTRRFKAYQMLGRDYIPAKVVKQDSRDAAMVQFSENFHRQDLNPMEQATMLKFMLEELGYSIIEIARFCNKSRDWVSRQLGLLDLDQQTQEAIAAARLSPSVAHELKNISDPKLRTDYINYAIQGGCTEKAARDWARQAKATIAARDMRIAQKDEHPGEEQDQVFKPPAPRTCALCNAPEDKVLLEPWDICWHCGQKLKGHV
ncbi:Nucleoid occlusion protein [subsurface metagenome]